MLVWKIFQSITSIHKRISIYCSNWKAIIFFEHPLPIHTSLPRLLCIFMIHLMQTKIWKHQWWHRLVISPISLFQQLYRNCVSIFTKCERNAQCALQYQSLIIDYTSQMVSSSVNWPIKHSTFRNAMPLVGKLFKRLNHLKFINRKIMSWYSVVIALKQFTSCLKAIIELVKMTHTHSSIK